MSELDNVKADLAATIEERDFWRDEWYKISDEALGRMPEWLNGYFFGLLSGAFILFLVMTWWP